MPEPLRHLVPIENENGWSDLLAALLETDPEPVVEALGLDPGCRGRLLARRETTVDRRDRIDLLLDVDGQLRTVLEAKVLSGLGREQLARYRAAWPDAANYVLLTLRRFPIGIDARAEGWREVSWETLLEALATSKDAWVARTARNWLVHLDAALPQASGTLRWDEVDVGEPWVLTMRTRMAWVFGQLDPPAPVVADLVASSAGNSWVARMRIPTVVPGYHVVAEAEERLPVRVVPRIMTADGLRPLGPTILVALQQTKVDTSADFDWDWLLAMWPAMRDSGLAWHQGLPGLPTPHDKANQRRIIEAGAPPFLGYGYGHRQTKRSRACMFGAQVRLPGSDTLDEIAAALTGVTDLIQEMAAIRPPRAGSANTPARRAARLTPRDLKDCP